MYDLRVIHHYFTLIKMPACMQFLSSPLMRRCVTLNQTPETKKKYRSGPYALEPLDPLNFGAQSYLLLYFAVMSKRKQGNLLANFGFTKKKKDLDRSSPVHIMDFWTNLKGS